ncbi:hypothetical protein OG883_43970 [Streptomyces sp. NBC_01142]|uniref:hypothetical protein n=1 Tax=Streptomyces sp. NBC_01142 TaxID=2975865 RepID=UPI002258CADF|nr:hypothetical protein [Streptomyces sp. NBC_01142]MCX4826600.1 hypothetical protein [Streptomyces sp. NBC_01142]
MSEWWKPSVAERAVSGDAGTAAPQLTLDPELPDHVQELLRQADPALLREAVAAERTSPWWGLADPLGGRRAAWWFGGLLLSVFARSMFMFGVGACAYGLSCAVAVLKRRRRTAVLLRIADAHDQFVLGRELNSEAAELLARAARAATRVQRSSVQRLDPADKLHNDRRLDGQVWEVADALRTYSRVAGQGPTTAVSAVVAQAMEPRRKILRISLSSIGRRVEALENYAAQIAEAEERRRELRQLRQLTTGTEELLDLLAATARDELAVTEIAGMSEEVAKALELFNEALQSAQDAATVALSSLAPDPAEGAETL